MIEQHMRSLVCESSPCWSSRRRSISLKTSASASFSLLSFPLLNPTSFPLLNIGSKPEISGNRVVELVMVVVVVVVEVVAMVVVVVVAGLTVTNPRVPRVGGMVGRGRGRVGRPSSPAPSIGG